MSVSIEEKDGCLIVSSVPAAGKKLLPPSPVKPQDSPDGQSKIISLPVSKKWQNRFPNKNKEAFFCLFALLGVGHPRWGDFEKSALKSPETRMNTEKNRGDNNFATPSWEGVTKLLSAGLMPFGRNLLKPKIKRNTQQNENSRLRIDTFDCFCNLFFCFLLFDVSFL